LGPLCLAALEILARYLLAAGQFVADCVQGRASVKGGDAGEHEHHAAVSAFALFENEALSSVTGLLLALSVTIRVRLICLRTKERVAAFSLSKAV
jgi:hypothetical protein